MSITTITIPDLDVTRVDTDEYEVRTEIGTFTITRKATSLWHLEMDDVIDGTEVTAFVGLFPTLLLAKGHIVTMINADRQLAADLTADEAAVMTSVDVALGAEGDQPAATDEPRLPAVHTFGTTGEAYDASQCRSDIKDGDILYVPAEGVVGFLDQAWPIAVTDKHGEFHATTTAWDEFEGGAYVASVAKAQELIEAMPPVTTRMVPLDGPGVTRGEFFATGGSVPAEPVELFELRIEPVQRPCAASVARAEQVGLFELTGLELSTDDVTVSRTGQLGLALV
jgi:hypothetical protein